MLSVAAARCRRINRSIELIVQPATKDAVGEMSVRYDLPPGYSVNLAHPRRRAEDVCIVERAKVHPKALYFPSPVTCTPEIYPPLRTVAHHPTGINLRMTEGLGNRERNAALRPTD